MKKRIPSLLATMIASALYSQQGLAADLATQCMLGVPSYDRPLVEGRPGDLPVTINADHAKGNYPDNAVFTGNVDINQGIVASAPTKFSCTSSRPRARRSRCARWTRWATCITTITR